ncbi:GNAT family N-acetyltransferase [Namhaeicola litoreus]|uniref:GNAT family N-acetyltransferase n=1 Tax=Namhaeicola litoreus TaxID=1052145 RepID=A0ABW3XZG4_9FLAO
MERYIFTSERIGFRNWIKEDLSEFAMMNADAQVMEHFPNILTLSETKDFIKRLQDHYIEHGHNYFAAELIETGEFIGFIGLAYQDYPTKYTPAVDVGWRLKNSAWGKGFATEGAERCLKFGFEELKLKRIISTCTEINTRSERVMNKIGMRKVGSFKHPKLSEHPDYENCICYQITQNEWKQKISND